MGGAEAAHPIRPLPRHQAQRTNPLPHARGSLRAPSVLDGCDVALRDMRRHCPGEACTAGNGRKDRTAEDAQRELEESLTPASPSHDEEEVESVRQLANENLIFKSSNDWGIPDLLPRMLADVDCLPDRTYNRHPDSVSETTYYCRL